MEKSIENENGKVYFQFLLNIGYLMGVYQIFDLIIYVISFIPVTFFIFSLVNMHFLH
jgi:hypothetical protein